MYDDRDDDIDWLSFLLDLHLLFLMHIVSLTCIAACSDRFEIPIAQGIHNEFSMEAFHALAIFASSGGP